MNQTIGSKVISYRNLIGLLWKYGNRTVLESIGLKKHVDSGEPNDEIGRDGQTIDRASSFAKDLEALGPTYVKIGQILAAQVDLLPQDFVEALARLQDDVAPFPFEQAAQIIEQDLGRPILESFSHIDTTPLGAASIGQVHRAVTLGGDQVAVKVQRPEARASIDRDMDSLIRAGELLDSITEEKYRLGELLNNAREMLEQELDYEMEADNLETIRRQSHEYDCIDVPKVYRELCGPRVLTMQFIEGKPITELSPRELDAIDGERLAERMFHAYLDHMLVEGMFHADPHPGNILMQPNGQLAMLDLGAVGRVDPRLREQLLQLLLAICAGEGTQTAEVALSIGTPTSRDFDGTSFREAISNTVLLHYTASRERLHIGQVVMRIARICGDHRVSLPQAVTLIGKALVNLDQLGAVLAPRFNPRRSIRRRLTRLLRRSLLRTLSPMSIADTVFELKHLAKSGPHQINRLLESLSRQDHGFKIDAIDEDRLINGFEKIANRITYGLIVAALFIAGAMVMNIENAGPMVADIPVIAWLMFTAAAVGTVWVVVSTWVK